jgi:transcription elongation factor GreA
VERNPVLMGFSIYINDEIMSAISYYTAEGLKKLRELDYLKSVMRPKHLRYSCEIKEICLKMLSMMQQRSTRNAEMRIAKLEEVHSNARLIDETNLDILKC